MACQDYIVPLEKYQQNVREFEERKENSFIFYWMNKR